MPRKMSIQVEVRKKKRMASERYMTIIIMFLIGKSGIFISKYLSNSIFSKLALRIDLITQKLFYNLVAFLVSWTPYAMVSMYSAFIDANGVSPLLGTVPAIFAKSSMLWTSVIFIWSNRQIRLKLLSQLGILRFMLCCNNTIDSNSQSPENNVSRDNHARATNSKEGSF